MPLSFFYLKKLKVTESDWKWLKETEEEYAVYDCISLYNRSLFQFVFEA